MTHELTCMAKSSATYEIQEGRSVRMIGSAREDGVCYFEVDACVTKQATTVQSNSFSV